MIINCIFYFENEETKERMALFELYPDDGRSGKL